jgi:hypothetical protein
MNSNPFQKAARAAWVELSSPVARQWYADSIISTTMMLLKLCGQLLDQLASTPTPPSCAG